MQNIHIAPRGAEALISPYTVDFNGLELRRQRDLDELEVFRVRDLVVPDPRRLVNARAGFRTHAAHAFVVEFDPAADDVEHLEVELVEVGARHTRSTGLRADHVSEHLAVRGVLDAEVAVLEE